MLIIINILKKGLWVNQGNELHNAPLCFLASLQLCFAAVQVLTFSLGRHLLLQFKNAGKQRKAVFAVEGANPGTTFKESVAKILICSVGM